MGGGGGGGCDANGVPLEKPKGKNPKRSIWEPYNEAQKSVIFEGWEVVSDETPNSGYRIITLVSKENSASLEFYYDTLGNSNPIDICVIFTHGGEQLPKEPTLAAVAAATTENPIKLK